MYERAWELCREIGKTALVFAALAGLSTFYLVRADIPRGLELVEEMLSPAQAQYDVGAQLRRIGSWVN
ncbi:MAG: hypothetical protein ACREUQ_13335 [Burkholderiales bacterium]